MTRRDVLKQSLAAATAVAMPTAIFAQQKPFDVVIRNGRVMDPETKLDAIRNVGIRGGTIAAISRSEIRGKVEIDAKGLVVAPGFIDPIAHGHNLLNDRLQIQDGVTTKLQMESGAPNVDEWYRQQAGNRIQNFGCSAGHNHARIAVLGENASEMSGTPAQSARIAALVDQGLRHGALGVGLGLEYHPKTPRMEVLDVFKMAGKYKASCHVHVRYGTLEEDTGAIAAIQEVMACSIASGAPLHVLHVPSMALRNTQQALAFIAQAQRQGYDISCDFYPYTAFGTGISSEVFAPGWQEKFGIDYGDVQWAKTNERLTKETFEKYRAEGGFVIAHAIPEAAVRAAASSTFCMVGSDGAIREGGVGHPRSAGTYARVLGHYSRDLKLLTLMQALTKMTILAAKRFEYRCPEFKKKGRVQVGCDADLVVFDAAKVIDKADFSSPALPSVGFHHVFVNGVAAVRNGKVIEDARPGKALRAKRSA